MAKRPTTLKIAVKQDTSNNKQELPIGDIVEASKAPQPRRFFFAGRPLYSGLLLE